MLCVIFCFAAPSGREALMPASIFVVVAVLNDASQSLKNRNRQICLLKLYTKYNIIIKAFLLTFANVCLNCLCYVLPLRQYSFFFLGIFRSAHFHACTIQRTHLNFNSNVVYGVLNLSLPCLWIMNANKRSLIQRKGDNNEYHPAQSTV